MCYNHPGRCAGPSAIVYLRFAAAGEGTGGPLQAAPNATEARLPKYMESCRRLGHRKNPIMYFIELHIEASNEFVRTVLQLIREAEVKAVVCKAQSFRRTQMLNTTIDGYEVFLAGFTSEVFLRVHRSKGRSAEGRCRSCSRSRGPRFRAIVVNLAILHS